MLADDRPILCFDIGGTSVKIGLFDVKENRLRYLNDIPTLPFQNNKDNENFEKLLVNTGSPYCQSVSALALASTGRISRDYKVEFWGSFNFLKRLDFKRIGSMLQCPAVALNDVSAAAYGEWASSEITLNNFLFLAIGTGIGGGIVLNGELADGQHGFAGEFGICSVYDAWVRSYTKVEDLCGGRAIAAGLGSDISELRTQKPELLWEVASKEFKHLAVAVQNAVNLLDISTVVLGGGITELLFPFYKRELGKSVRDLKGKRIKVRKARFGWKAVMVGIGYYAKHQLLTKEE